MLIRMVPRLITHAGMKRLSVGCSIDCIKVPLCNQNLRLIITTLKSHKAMLKRKKMQPIANSPWKSYGTILQLDTCSPIYAQGLIRTLAKDISNTSSSHLITALACMLIARYRARLTVMVNQVHVKCLTRCLKCRCCNGLWTW